MDFEFARLVRAAVDGTERDAGQSGPAQKDSQAPPNYDPGQGAATGRVDSGSPPRLDRGATGPAMRGAPNDYAWRDQDRVKLKAQREGYVDLGSPAAGASVNVDPNIAANFIVRAQGNLTLTFSAPEAIANPDPYAPAETFLHGVKIWVQRPSGAKVTWTGVMWSQDVLDPNGDADQKDSLLGAATKAGFDSYVVVVIPGFGTFGYLAGRGYVAAS